MGLEEAQDLQALIVFVGFLAAVRLILRRAGQAVAAECVEAEQWWCGEVVLPELEDRAARRLPPVRHVVRARREVFGGSERPRAAVISQRIASAWLRSGRTSTGT